MGAHVQTLASPKAEEARCERIRQTGIRRLQSPLQRRSVRRVGHAELSSSLPGPSPPLLPPALVSPAASSPPSRGPTPRARRETA